MANSPSVSPEPDETLALECLPGLFGRFDEGFVHEYYFSETSHALGLLQGLNNQRLQGVLCDVIICVSSHEFPCHRSVLAAYSPYFLAMFTAEMKECCQQRVPICGVEPHIMSVLIEYAYTANITITQDNAQQLLSAANLLQMNSIRDACCKFLEKEMDPSNCLGIHCFAEVHVCTKLAELSKEYAEDNFTEVAKHDEISLLPAHKLIEFLDSNRLRVSAEEIIFQAVINWAKHDAETRNRELPSVLQYVRLPFVSPYVLFDKMDTEPILTQSKECRVLLDEALKYHLLQDRRTELKSPRTKPRYYMATSDMICVIGGEVYNKNYLNCVDCYNFQDGRWWKFKDLPFSRCHHGVVLSGNQSIYVAGGVNKEKMVLNSVLRYEKALDKWLRIANMNTPRTRHGMAAVDGCVFVVGGYNGETRVATVECYSPHSNKWNYVAPLNMAISKCQAVGMGSYMYICGGEIDPDNQSVDCMQRYSLSTDSWETLSCLPIPRCLNALLATDGCLYAVGGTSDSVSAAKQLTRYDPSSNSWTELSSMEESRFDAGAVHLNNKIYVLSGHDGENSFYHSIEVYDIPSDTWATFANSTLPFGRCRFGCVALPVTKK